MAEKKPESEAAAEADLGDKLDRLLTGLDSIGKRLDVHEKRMDAMEEGADKARKDAGKKDSGEFEQELEGKPRQVAADAQGGLTEDRQNEIERIAAQERADSVAQAFGESAPKPMSGETALAYRQRMANRFKQYSKEFGELDVGAIADAATFGAIENHIYADAVAAAASPEAPEGHLLTRSRTLPSGHRENTFFGRPSAWMSQFSGNRRFVTRINPNAMKQD